MRVTSAPYRRCTNERVVVEPWQSVAGGHSERLPPQLPHWDYNVDLRLARIITVDEAGVRRDTHLPAPVDLRAVVVWRSTGNALRGRGIAVPLGSSPVPRELRLSADVPGQLLSGEIQVRTQIVLAESAAVHPLAAKYAGSVLWEDEVSVALEGSASRFPIEVVDFNTTHWAPYGGAGWYLAWNSEELHEPFLRNVRLFVNSSHSKVLAAVQAVQPTPEESAIRSAMYCDIGRQLIRGALNNSDFIDEFDSFADGSTGRAILRMLGLVFPGDKPRQLRSTMLTRPEYFDSSIQASLRLFAQ